MCNLFIKKKLFARYPFLPKSILYNVLTLPEGKTSGSGSYEKNSFVTVSAIAPNGFRFLNWTEDGKIVSTKSNYTFIINSDRELVANFEESTYTVTTSVNPTGAGTTTGAGTYTHEENVTVTASPKSGYQFLNWTENNNIASRNKLYSFKITKDRNLIANFELLSYSVTTSVNPENAGVVTGAGTYTHGLNVTVKATPNTGYTFINWTENGDEVSANPYTFTITNNRNLTANFSKLRYSISASASPSGKGTITGTGAYEYGNTAYLNATPNDGYRFVSWTENGTVVSTSNLYSFTVTKNRTLVANFEQEIVLYTITVNWGEGGRVAANNIIMSSNSRSYDKGTTITLRAIPNSGYKFKGWALMGPGGSYSAITGVTGDTILIDNIDRDYTFSVTFEYQIDILSEDYLIFLALEDDCEIKFNTESALYRIDLTYSIDEGNTWELMPDEGVIINENEYILFNKGRDIYQTRAAQVDKIGTFEVNKNFKALGHPYCLITNDFNADTVINEDTPSGVFQGLFSGCATLLSVPKNFLFAKRIVANIYESMFSGCTALETAPDLPATLSTTIYELGDCYLSMFNGCTNLKNGPTISLNLYELSAHASYTFASMFNGCTNLKSIKFNGGGLLQNNDVGFGVADGLFLYWVNGVTAEGELTVTNSSYNTIFSQTTKNVHGLPQNWTLVYSPEATVTPGTGTPSN